MVILVIRWVCVPKQEFGNEYKRDSLRSDADAFLSWGLGMRVIDWMTSVGGCEWHLIN